MFTMKSVRHAFSIYVVQRYTNSTLDSLIEHIPRKRIDKKALDDIADTSAAITKVVQRFSNEY